MKHKRIHSIKRSALSEYLSYQGSRDLLAEVAVKLSKSYTSSDILKVDNLVNNAIKTKVYNYMRDLEVIGSINTSNGKKYVRNESESNYNITYGGE